MMFNKSYYLMNFLKKVRQKGEGIPLIKFISLQTSISAEIILIVLFFFLIFIIMKGVANGELVMALCALFAAYKSFKAMKKDDMKEFKPYLCFWILFSLLLALNYFVGFILTEIPFFNIIRLIFLIYLLYDKCKFSEFIFDIFVGPLFSKYEIKIDEHIQKLSDKISSAQELGKDAIKGIATSEIVSKITKMADEKDKKE